MKQVLFFSTQSDISPVITSLEKDSGVIFVRSGHYDIMDPPVLSSKDLSNVGIATSETASTSISYLIMPSNSKIISREYISEDPMTFGRKQWSVYNGFNEDSVEMTLAGIWEGKVLLPGSVKTMHNTPFAQMVIRKFASLLKQAQFKKIQSWWLGPEALQMLRAGKRLSTTAVQSPPDYDLRPEHIPAELK
ncbi:hypothetical protein ACETRX_10420 [Labrys portucalensis]|uniref:Uncharacterized protein n=1 Tax=Labrys neptuniae TaxID=376174 RepID=A0ABV6ZCX0_9HYPH